MTPMVDAAMASAINTVVTTAIAAAVTWCVQRVRVIAQQADEDRKRDEARQDARDLGTLALLHAKLTDAYEDHVLSGEPLSIDRRRDIDRIYEAYHAMGGNGTGTDIYRRICRVEISASCPVRRADRPGGTD